jgi:hypothetical protein
MNSEIVCLDISMYMTMAMHLFDSLEHLNCQVLKFVEEHFSLELLEVIYHRVLQVVGNEEPATFYSVVQNVLDAHAMFVIA